MKSMTRPAATAFGLSLALGLASLAFAAGTELTTSALVSSETCSADYSSATVKINISVTSTASAAPATVTVSNNGGATFTPIGTIYIWSQSGRDKSATLTFSEVVPANTTTNFEVCAAQPGNGNPDQRSCANLSIDPICASYIPRTTVDYTASGVDFLVVGNWGEQDDSTDVGNNATQMNTVASNSNSKFVLSLGSNFYRGGTYSYEGVESITDAKFTTLWKDVFEPGATLPALSPLPWWLLLGNHDWYTTNSQIYEIQHVDPNWNLPDYFHVQRFALPNSKHATLIYISDDLLFYGYTGKGRTDMGANFTTALWTAANNTHLKQLAWIDKALETANQDDYVLVLGHHSVFTCGSDVSGASTFWAPLRALIDKWKPTAYLTSGHATLAYYLSDSTLQISVGSTGTVDAACAPFEFTAPGYELPNTYGFAHAQLTGSEFAIQFVDETGAVPRMTPSNSPMQTSASPRTPVTGQKADTTYLPPVGDPSIHISIL